MRTAMPARPLARGPGTSCRGLLRLLALVAALTLAPPIASLAEEPDWDAVQIQAIPLGGGVHALTGRGGNMGLSTGPDGPFLIDDQFAPLTDRIVAAVRAISDGPIRFVLNTHWHGDHTGGNESLGRAGALIFAHDNVRALMSVDQIQRLRGRTVPAAPPGALPVVTFSEALTFYWNGQEIHAFHAPAAHTSGDTIVHFRGANVIHMGDTFFNGSYPFIDVDSGGSVDGVLAAAQRVLEISDERTRLIPGHGPLADAKALRAYRDMLTVVRDRVRSAIERGESLEQVLAARPSAEYDADWGGGFIDPATFVRILYADLSR